jgi:hypothetical protein
MTQDTPFVTITMVQRTQASSKHVPQSLLRLFSFLLLSKNLEKNIQFREEIIMEKKIMMI